MSTDISTFDKDQLADYAKTEFNLDLDLRKGLEKLRAEVKAMQVTFNKKDTKAAAITPPPAKFLLNRNTGLVFPYSDEIRQHLTNAIPCDEAGNPV